MSIRARMSRNPKRNIDKRNSQATQVIMNQPVSRRRKLLRITSAPWRKLPDFLIIGAQKGGTSSLFYYLSQHSEFELSAQKEIHYFNSNYYKGIYWYRSFFPYRTSGKLTGEASPCYLFHPRVPARVKRDLPGVKLIVLLRDPILRAYSHYQMIRKWGFETLPSFDAAIEAEAARMVPELEKIDRRPFYKSFVFENYSYTSRSRYAEQIRRWRSHFSRERFLFIQSESFFTHPQRELERVYRFLGVSDFQPTDLKPQHVGRYPEMQPATYQYLKNKLEGQQAELSELIGREIRWDL